MPEPVDTARLFIALWPPAALAQALHARCAAVAARCTAAARLHLTLHFLGPVARDRLPALRAALCVPFQPFDLEVAGSETWPRGLLVVPPVAVPAELQALHAALAQRLGALGLPVDERPFRPHVTLARRQARAIPTPALDPTPETESQHVPAFVPPIAPPLPGWPVRDYLLAESLPGPPARYRWLLRCGVAGTAPFNGAQTMELTSPAFTVHAAIPRRHSCEGEDLSPALQWSGLPEGTASLALIVDDPDAPDPAAPQRTWVHWVLYDIPPAADGLPEGGHPLPAGTQAGLNDWGRPGYGGPCPPIGRHRYFFRLYALDCRLPALARPTRAALDRAMQGHVLAQAELVGTYARSGR